MATRKRSKDRVTKESLKQIALSHSQTTAARDDQAKRQGTTEIVMEMFDKQLRGLEQELMVKFKEWSGMEVKDGA